MDHNSICIVQKFTSKKKFVTIVDPTREYFWAATKTRPFSRIPTTKPPKLLAAEAADTTAAAL